MANPGMDWYELENLGYYAYRTLADGAMASSSTMTPAAGEGINFEEKDAGNRLLGAETEKESEAEGTEKESIVVVEKEGEVAPNAEKIEGPRDAGNT